MLPTFDDVGHVCSALAWLVRGCSGLTSLRGFEPDRLFRLWLAVSSMFFAGLLFVNAYFGNFDRFYFIITLVQLVLAVLFFAITPENVSDKSAWDRKWMAFVRDDAVTLLLLGIGSILLCKVIVAVQCGSATLLLAIDLYGNLFFAFLLTALPWIHLDADADRQGLGWKLWFLEVVDAMSLIVGYVQFAQPGMDASWTHHFIAFGYFILVVVFCAGFGALSQLGLIGIYQSSNGTLHEQRRKMFLFSENRAMVIQMVFLLDCVTDAPSFLVTILNRSYVGNIGFTINVISNMIVFLRAVFYFASNEPANAREPLPGQEPDYIRIA